MLKTYFEGDINRLKIVKYFSTFIITYIVTVLLFLLVDDTYRISDDIMLLKGTESQTYDLSDILLNGYDVSDGNIIIANCNDGQIYLPMQKKRIINLCISLREPLQHDTSVVIYYVLGSENYTEDQAIHTVFSEKKADIIIPVKENVSAIRIDLGNNKGDRFAIDNITVNYNNIWYSSSIYFFWIVLLAAVILFQHRKSAFVVNCKNYVINVLDEDRKILTVVFVLILAFTVCILYKDYLSGNKNYLFIDIGSDSYYQTYPYQIYMARDIANGNAKEAHWNHTNSLGNGQGAFIPNISNWYLCFGEKYVAYMMGVNQVLKVFFAGLFFYMYLRTMGILRWGSGIFAICYAFNAHIILRGSWPSYPAEAMLFALWLYGFECWKKDKSKWGILVAVTVIFYSNTGGYTTVLYSGIFVVYAAFRILISKDGISWIQIGKNVIKFVAVMLLALFIAGVSLGGIISSSMKTQRFSAGQSTLSDGTMALFTDWNVLFTAFLRTIGTDIVGITDFVGSQNLLEAPAFYCGLITLLLLPVACLCADKRKKIGYNIALMGVMGYVIFVPVRFLLNGLGGTETFKLSSFWIIVLLLYIAATEIENIIIARKYNWKIFLLEMICVNFLAVVLQNILGGSTPALFRSLLFVNVYGVLFAVYQYRKLKPAVLKIALLLLVVGEVYLMSYAPVNDRVTIEQNYYEDGTIEAIEKIADQTNFYRVDKQYYSLFLSDSLYQHYNGTNAYIGGTGDRVSTINFYDAFGMPKSELNRYLWGFSASTYVNTIMNVKYILSRSGIIGNFGYSYLTEQNGIKIYQNQYALPLGYTYCNYILLEDFLNLDVEARRRVVFKACVVEEPVEGMNALQPEITSISDTQWSRYLVDVEVFEGGNEVYIFLEKNEANVTTVLQTTIQNEGAEIFYVGCSTSEGVQSYCYSVENGINKYYMEYSDKDITELQMYLSEGMKACDIKVYQIPSEEYYAEYIKDCAELSENSLTIEKMNDKEIRGTITSDRMKLLTFSIPNQANWHLYIDDTETGLQTVNIGMMGAIITEGVHDVRLEYYVQDSRWKQVLIGGSVLVIYIGYRVYRRKKYLDNCVTIELIY